MQRARGVCALQSSSDPAMYQTFLAKAWFKLLKYDLYKRIILWSQNSVIKATPTTCIGGPRNTRLFPTSLYYVLDIKV